MLLFGAMQALVVAVTLGGCRRAHVSTQLLTLWVCALGMYLALCQFGPHPDGGLPLVTVMRATRSSGPKAVVMVSPVGVSVPRIVCR